MAAELEVGLFVSWAHADKPLKADLMWRLLPHLATFARVRVTCWQDQDLYLGDELTEAVTTNLDAAQYGLLLLSPSFFASTFIRGVELPRFVGPAADRHPIPVDLVRMPLDGSYDLGGVERTVVFRHLDRSYNRTTGHGRDDFALELAGQLRRRILRDHGRAG